MENPPPPQAQPPLAYATPGDLTNPYFDPWAYQAARDASNLNLLSILHYVYGAIIIAFSSIALVHTTLGIVMIVNPGAMMGAGQQAPPAFLGWMFFLLGAGFLLLGWTLGILTIYSGRCIKRRKYWMFSFIIACINCIHVPLGTALGVFTLVMLLRQSVQGLYGRSTPGASGAPIVVP